MSKAFEELKAGQVAELEDKILQAIHSHEFPIQLAAMLGIFTRMIAMIAYSTPIPDEAQRKILEDIFEKLRADVPRMLKDVEAFEEATRH